MQLAFPTDEWKLLTVPLFSLVACAELKVNRIISYATWKYEEQGRLPRRTTEASEHGNIVPGANLLEARTGVKNEYRIWKWQRHSGATWWRSFSFLSLCPSTSESYRVIVFHISTPFLPLSLLYFQLSIIFPSSWFLLIWHPENGVKKIYIYTHWLCCSCHGQCK